MLAFRITLLHFTLDQNPSCRLQGALQTREPSSAFRGRILFGKDQIPNHSINDLQGKVSKELSIFALHLHTNLFSITDLGRLHHGCSVHLDTSIPFSTARTALSAAACRGPLGETKPLSILSIDYDNCKSWASDRRLRETYCTFLYGNLSKWELH